MEQQDQQPRLWTKPFIALTISSLLLFLNLQMLLSSFPAYAKDQFQVDDMMLSLITSVFAASAIVTRFMSAYLLRKISRSVLLYIGVGIAAGITAIYVLADSIGSLLLMRVGYGIGFGMASTIIPTLVSQIIPARRMGEGIGYFGLSTSLAMSIGPMIGLNIMNAEGFGTLAWAGTITMLLAFPVLMLSRSIPSTPRQEHTAFTPHTSTNSASVPQEKAPFNRKLLFPALLNVLLAITYAGLLSFIALFGQYVHLKQVGLFFLFNAFTIIIIRPISGKVFDRKGHAAVLIPAAACVIASLIVLSYTTTMPMLVVSALLYGLGFGAIQPTIQAWMLRTSNPNQYGMANSMFYNSTDLGVAAGALVLGAISSVSDYAMMYRYSAGFMLVFLIVFAGVHYFTRMNKEVITSHLG